ncbi:MAG: hypothetical protein LBU53_04160 [Zoogloeaceae bacterium]|nr:hypothetical protein [Zoogloeaceae bacterium]
MWERGCGGDDDILYDGEGDDELSGDGEELDGQFHGNDTLYGITCIAWKLVYDFSLSDWLSCGVAHEMKTEILPEGARKIVGCHSFLKLLPCAAWLLALLPVKVWAWAPCTDEGAWFYYNKAKAVALIEVKGYKEKPFYPSDISSSMTVRTADATVLKSWKSVLPKSIQISSSSYTGDVPSSFHIVNGVYLVYLQSDEAGEYWPVRCEGNLHESGNGFHERMLWFEKIANCDATKLDEQTLYERADAVVYAEILGVTEKKGKNYIDLKVWRFWKSSVPGFLSIQSEFLSDTDYPVHSGEFHFLFLRRNQAGQFSTGFCSGNVRNTAVSEINLEPGLGYTNIALGKQLDLMANIEDIDKHGMYDNSDAVVRAKVTRIEMDEGEVFAHLKVLNAWKLDVSESESLFVRIDNSSAIGFPVHQGQWYFFYLHRGKDGVFTSISNLQKFDKDAASKLNEMTTPLKKLIH